MWTSGNGEIVLHGKMAALFQNSLKSLVFCVQGGMDTYNEYITGVRVFDAWTGPEKLAVLEQIASGLLEESVPAPELTAVAEAAVAVVFYQVLDNVHLEIGEGGTKTRRLILAARRQLNPDAESLPQASCDDLDKWHLLTEGIIDYVLWDRDWEEKFVKLDHLPEKARMMRKVASIDEDYYSAVPPDPNPQQLASIKENLTRLYRSQHFRKTR
jgi:hypothetical protein